MDITKTKVYIYLRSFEDNKTISSEELKIREIELTEFANKNNYEIANIYQDDTTSEDSSLIEMYEDLLYQEETDPENPTKTVLIESIDKIASTEEEQKSIISNLSNYNLLEIFSNLSQKTKNLKQLLPSAKKSAKDAWRAGNLLFNIKKGKEYKEKYKTFTAFTDAEFQISETTANKYIEIYDKIDYKDVSDDILLTHLYRLAGMQTNLRRKLLSVISRINKEKKFGKYGANDLSAIEEFIEASKKDLSIKDISQLFKKVIQWRKEKTSIPGSKGPLIDTPHFPTVKKIYPFEPTNEQGLVGLFCSIFHLLKDLKFEFKGYNFPLSFAHIVYIGTMFPDAQIEFTLHGKKQTSLEKKVEFEFESRNYFLHKHDKAKNNEECEMVICWEDNVKDFNLPPTLSIKTLFESGKIEFRY